MGAATREDLETRSHVHHQRPRDLFHDRERDLFLGSVLQKTFVAVDEKGTEAAAATVAMMAAGGAPVPSPPVELRADHPFLFAIRDTRRVGLLFPGRVSDPAAS